VCTSSIGFPCDDPPPKILTNKAAQSIPRVILMILFLFRIRFSYIRVNTSARILLFSSSIALSGISTSCVISPNILTTFDVIYGSLTFRITASNLAFLGANNFFDTKSTNCAWVSILIGSRLCSNLTLLHRQILISLITVFHHKQVKPASPKVIRLCF
jgi:hypothetical protein